MKLKISEDTACVASKTSYMDEDGLDKNGIYYFGDKPNLPTSWRKVFKKSKNVKQIKERCDYMKLRINESVDFDHIVDQINEINTSDISSRDKVNQITEILRTMKNDYVIDLARNEKSGSNHFIKVRSMWVDTDAGAYSYSNYDIADEIVNGRLRLVVDIWDKSKVKPLGRRSNRIGFLDDATKDRKNYGQKDGFYGI